MSLSVIGAGFGRTGTLSLKGALEHLGFGPCYHMIEVIRNPGFADWWHRAADGAPVDWDRVFDGYRATVDWPACRFYRRLAAHYPDAKVILTVRDPARWFESARNTIFPMMTRPRPTADPLAERRLAMAKKIIIEQTFGGRIDDRGHAISVFERHNDEVRRAIAADRLLVYDLAQGWPPLCRFLDRPVPDAPMPSVNSTAEFRQRFAASDQTSPTPSMPDELG